MLQSRLDTFRGLPTYRGHGKGSEGMALWLLRGRLHFNTCKWARWCGQVSVGTSCKDYRVAYMWVNSLVWAIVGAVVGRLGRSSKGFRTHTYVCVCVCGGGGGGGGGKYPRREDL